MGYEILQKKIFEINSQKSDSNLVNKINLLLSVPV